MVFLIATSIPFARIFTRWFHFIHFCAIHDSSTNASICSRRGGKVFFGKDIDNFSDGKWIQFYSFFVVVVFFCVFLCFFIYLQNSWQKFYCFIDCHLSTARIHLGHFVFEKETSGNFEIVSVVKNNWKVFKNKCAMWLPWLRGSEAATNEVGACRSFHRTEARYTFRAAGWTAVCSTYEFFYTE